jgi:hypothetical protein
VLWELNIIQYLTFITLSNIIMALVFGYYDKNNLGDEQYKISISKILKQNGHKEWIKFVNPYDINTVPSDTQIIICGGGDIINDWFHEKISEFTGTFRGPIIALSIGITYESTICEKYLKQYDHIVLRHVQLMNKVITVKNHSCVQTIPDLGFCLDPAIPTKFNKPRIGVFVVNGCNIDGLHDALHPFEDHYDIVQYNMNFSGEAHEGDQCVNTGLKQVSNIHHVETLMSHIGGLHLSICIRYHSHVFSIIQGIPFVSVALTPKTQMLMKDHDFKHNVVTKISDLRHAVTWCLANYTQLKTKVQAVHTNCRTLLSNFTIPELKRSIKSISTECLDMVQKGVPHKHVAHFALLNTIGSSENKYTYGFEENIANGSRNFEEMCEWVATDMNQAKPEQKIRFLQTADSFSGVHRSGWELVAKRLKSIESPTGMLCDLYVDASFHWNSKDLIARGILPFRQNWIGFIHHTMIESYSPYNTTDLFSKAIWHQSLKHCKLLIVLSEYLATLLRSHLKTLQLDVEVKVVKHPTLWTTKKFDFHLWSKNLTITQVGSWLRNTYAIYALKILWGKKQVLEGPKMENYIHPQKWFLLNTRGCSCEYESSKFNTNTICRPPHETSNKTTMTTFMTEYIHHECKAPSFMEVRSGSPCCKSGSEWPKSLDYIHRMVGEVLEANYKSVTRISTLSNNEYDTLLQSTVVFMNLLDCSATNTIVECIMRGTPVVVNPLPAVKEYLGNEYPGYYSSMHEVKEMFDLGKINGIASHMKKIDKEPLMFDNFVTTVESYVNEIEL